MLNDYEAAAVRSWAVDHARKVYSSGRVPCIDELLEDAKKIEAYLTGRASATLTTITRTDGKRK